MLSGLLHGQSPDRVAEKTTTGIAYQRVIAQSTKDSTGVYFDSVSLFYGPNKGSTYDYNDMIYPYNYPYSTSPMFNYAGTFTKPQVLFDTLMHWTLDPNANAYGYYETDNATYDVHSNLETYKASYADSAINANRNFINKFNTAYNIDTAWSFNYISGVSDSAFRQFFSYNSSHLLIEDSTYEYHSSSWHLVSKTYYTYDGSNNLTEIDNYSNNTDTTFTLPLVEQLQYINTYDASHRLLTVASNYYYGSGFGPYVRDTFAYTGTNAWHSSWKEYQYDPINLVWAPQFNMSKVANISGLPDTVTIQGFDSILNAWVPQSFDVISYNTSHNPDTLKEYDYNFTAFPSTASYTTLYYYQTAYNTVETNPVAGNPDVSMLYPNPVAGQLTITGLNAALGARLSVSMLNETGQVVSRETFSWQGQKQVGTQELLPGIYWVVIQDETGALLHRQSIVRQ